MPLTPQELTRIRRAADQWQHNRGFVSTISVATYTDWAVTCAFYTALHAVEVLLHADQVPDHQKHWKRSIALQKSPRYDQIYPPYNLLSQAAHTTRYSAQPRMWIQPANFSLKILDDGLYKVEEEVRRLVSGLTIGISLPAHVPIIWTP